MVEHDAAVAALVAAGYVVEPGDPVEGVDAPIINVVLGAKDWTLVSHAQVLAADHGCVCNFHVWPAAVAEEATDPPEHEEAKV